MMLDDAVEIDSRLGAFDERLSSCPTREAMRSGGKESVLNLVSCSNNPTIGWLRCQRF